MKQLDCIQIINENSLDGEYYFQSLFLEACRTNLLSDTQIEQIQLQLVELMGKEVERYTNDESSSIPIEKAQDILQSITYCMGCYLKSLPDMNQKLELLRHEPIIKLFYQGMEKVSVIYKQAKDLLLEIQKNMYLINNIAYQDTIREGIPQFFREYQIEFGAHDLPSCIDYPLQKTITDLLGVELMYEYLNRFAKEQSFLLHFTAEQINELLAAFDQDAEHMLINIYELVLTNAIGRQLLGYDGKELNLLPEDLSWLQYHLGTLKTKELEQRLEIALENLERELALNKSEVHYAKESFYELSARIAQNLQTQTLEQIFPSYQKTNQEVEQLVDGMPMEDEKLRALVEKLQEYKSVSSKWELIRSTVRSVADLTELLSECFIKDEYIELFQLFQEDELTVLIKSIQLDTGRLDYREVEPRYEWQTYFIDYYTSSK